MQGYSTANSLRVVKQKEEKRRTNEANENQETTRKPETRESKQ